MSYNTTLLLFQKHFANAKPKLLNSFLHLVSQHQEVFYLWSFLFPLSHTDSLDNLCLCTKKHPTSVFELNLLQCSAVSMVGKVGYPFSKENTVNMRINGELEIKIYRKIMKMVVAHNQFLTNYTYSFPLFLFVKNQSCSASFFVSNLFQYWECKDQRPESQVL